MSQTYKISTGRGGAGNMTTSKDRPSPKLIPQGSQTPNILSPVFSTGRGGAGNMRKNVDSKMTRRAQDVELSESEDKIDSVDEITPHFSGEGLNTVQSAGLKPKKSRHEPPKSVAIGRGGAGNILSPTASKKSHTSSKGKKDAKKPGVWGKVKKLFS